MRSLYRFLFKVLAYSLGLFVFWGLLAKIYGQLLDVGLRSFNPDYIYAMKEKWVYSNSMFLIPLISLVLATPRISKVKKTGTIIAGMVAIILLDSLRVRFEIGDAGPSAGYAIYHGLKLLVPFSFWLAMSYGKLETIFKSEHQEGTPATYSCPICKAEHPHIVAHIQESHGEKSLKSKKVKKFLAHRPELSLSCQNQTIASTS